MGPAVLPAVAAGGFAALSGTTILGLSVAASAIVIAGATLVLGIVQQAFVPDIPSFRTEAVDRTVLARTTAAAQTLVFGEAMISGPLNLFESSGTSKEFLHVSVPHCYWPCDGIVAWFVNEERVGTLDGSGNVTDGRFADHVRLVAHTGAFDQAAAPNLVAEVANWTDDHKGGSVTYSEARLKFSQDVWPNGFSNLKAIVRGMPLFDPRDTAATITASNTASPSVFSTSAAHGRSVGDYVWIQDHDGAVVVDPPEDNPNVSKFYQVGTVPAVDEVTLIDPDGNPVVLSTGGTGGTVTLCKWSDNWALAVRFWMTHRDGFNITDAEIDDPSFIAAANISDEQVALTHEAEIYTVDTAADTITLANGRAWKTGDVVRVTTTGTQPTPLALLTDYVLFRPHDKDDDDGVYQLATSLENARAGVAIVLTDAGTGDQTVTRNSQLRYTCNGVVTMGEGPLDILEQMMSAGAGVVTYTGGEFQLYAGAATTSSANVDESDLRDGAVELVPTMSRAKVFNAARGTYVDPDKFWTLADAHPYRNATYRAEDNNEEIYQDFSFPYTTDPVAAQRLLKIQVERVRQGAVLKFPGKPKGFETAVWDVEAVSLDHFGYVNKEFRVLGWIERPDQGVDKLFREEAAAAWDWNLGDETTIDLAPNTNLPSAFNVVAPTNLVITSGDAVTAVGADGSLQPAMKVTFDKALDAFVTHHEVEWKLTSDADYQSADVPLPQAEFFVKGVAKDQVYDVRVRARNINQVRSAYITDQHTVLGKATPPLPPTTFLASQQADGTRRYTWTIDSPPDDVRVGGGIQIRYFLGSTSDWSAMTDLHTGGLLQVSPFDTTDPAASGTYTFAAKVVNASGVESATATFHNNVTLGDTRQRDVILSRAEHELVWPGTLTDCFIIGGVLEADGTTGSAWDDQGTWDDMLTWLDIPRLGTLRYTTPTIDLGSNLTFTPTPAGSASGTLSFEMRTHTEAEGADLSAEPWVAIAQVVNERYIEIRATVTGTSPVLITMTVNLDAEVKTDNFEDVDVATESATWFERVAAGHFKVGHRDNVGSITKATLALQNVGGGWTWELISKGATISGHPNPAAEFKVYNASTVLADAVVDVELQGPFAG